jgi:hypothetical protein
MLGIGQAAGRDFLDHLAGVHHQNAVAERGHQAQIVRDEEECFVNFGEKLLKVKVHKIGYDYATVEVIDPNETPEAMELKGKTWVVHFNVLMIRKKE